jgi:hypothetical protein
MRGNVREGTKKGRHYTFLEIWKNMESDSIKFQFLGLIIRKSYCPDAVPDQTVI